MVVQSIAMRTVNRCTLLALAAGLERGIPLAAAVKGAAAAAGAPSNALPTADPEDPPP